MTEKGEEGENRRKIRLMESNAKCRHLKKLTSNGTLRQVFICRRPRIVYTPPPLHIVYGYTVWYTFSHRGGGRVNQREG
jgi:hypothetical protein